MIPEAHIAAWQNEHPWEDATLVEHDLLLSRALCSIFQHPKLAEVLRFRGGTAIHKLVMCTPGRFSEDLDLIYIKEAKIGPMLDCFREAMAWFDGPIKHTYNGTRFYFYFTPTHDPTERQRIKIEFNISEKEFSEDPILYNFTVNNPWFNGEAKVWSFPPEDLLGSKLLALLSRAKDRDLFDFYDTKDRLDMDIGRVMQACIFYASQRRAKTPLTRAVAEQRLLDKLGRPNYSRVNLTPGVERFLRQDGRYTEDDALATLAYIFSELLPELPGRAWRSASDVLHRQSQRYPVLRDLAAAVARSDAADSWQPGNR